MGREEELSRVVVGSQNTTMRANENGGGRHAPPQGYNNHQYYYPPPSSSASFKGCCCCLFLFAILLVLLAIAAALVVVLAVKPKKPHFDLQEVTVQYVGISPSAAAASSSAAAESGGVPVATLSLRIGMSFTAENDNKVGIEFGESRFTVMYRGVPLGRAAVPGFFQPAHSVRRVNTTISVDRVNLLQTDAADLMKDALVNDRVDLRVLGDVGAKIRIVGLSSPTVQVSVDCAIVISPKNQSVTYKQCGFEGFNI